MGDHIISFLDICAMRGQLVLAKAPSIPAIDNKTVYCTGALPLKNTNLRAGPTRCQKTNEAKKATCTNVRTA